MLSNYQNKQSEHARRATISIDSLRAAARTLQGELDRINADIRTLEAELVEKKTDGARVQ